MTELFLMLAVFVLSFIIGYFLISRVPPLLHTPLMSMANAISAVVILGAVLLFDVKANSLVKVLGSIAIIAAMFNMVGGFVITERMLKMFKKKTKST
jgi:NAD(P) transhydrogenase subunit alpha